MKAHPKVNGRPLQLGDRVRTTSSHRPEGEITDIHVRCWGRHEMEEITGPGFVKIGEREMEQVWIFLDNTNQVFSPEDILEVLEPAP